MNAGIGMSGRAGPILETGLFDSYKPLGAFGQPVYLSHVQLKAAVRQKLGSRYASFFANPDRDPRGGELRWMSDVQGEAVRWSDLPPDQQLYHAMLIEEMRSGFAQYREELRGMQSSQQALAFAALLDVALQIPDSSHLFLVGDQPVACFWGFAKGNGATMSALSVAPLNVAAAHVPDIPADPPPPPVRPALAAEAGRRRWARWLLWLIPILLLFLLLWLLVWWLRPQIVVPLPFGSIGRVEVPIDRGVIPAPDTAARDQGMTERERSPALLAPRTGDAAIDTVEPGYRLTPGPNGLPLKDPPMNGGIPIDSIPGAGGELPAVGPEDKSGPGQDKAGEKPMEPPKDKPLPPKPDLAGDKPGEKPGEKLDDKAGDKASNKPGPPPKPGLELAIPDKAPGTADALSFLEGEWRGNRSLVDRRSGKPVEQYYRFDRSGKGEAVIRRADGSECRAPAQAVLNNRVLTVDELENIRCPDGVSYDRARTECRRLATGQTVCTGTNPDGSTYRIGIQKGN